MYKNLVPFVSDELRNPAGRNSHYDGEVDGVSAMLVMKLK